MPRYHWSTHKARFIGHWMWLQELIWMVSSSSTSSFSHQRHHLINGTERLIIPLDMHVNWAECKGKLKWHFRPPLPLASYYLFSVLGAIFLYIGMDSCAFPWVLLPPCKSEPPPLRRSEIEFSVRWSRKCQPTCGFAPLRLIFSRALFGGSFSLLTGSHSLPFTPIRPFACKEVTQQPGFAPLRLIYHLSGDILGSGWAIFPLSRLPFAPIRPLYLSELSPYLCLPSAPTHCLICLPLPKSVPSRKSSRFHANHIIFCYSTVWHR